MAGSIPSRPTTDPELREHVERYAHAYASGVLDPAAHRRLVEGAEDYAARAGIDPRYLWEPAAAILTEPREMEYAVGVREHGRAGLVYLGLLDPLPDVRMAAMAGLFMRNFLTCRVMSADELVGAQLDGDGVPDPFALFLPQVTTGVAARERGLRSQVVPEVVASRARRGRQTILAAASRERVEKAYGEEMVAVLRGFPFVVVKGTGA